MDKIDGNYGNALDAINSCLTCLKNGGRTEDILLELLNTFNADDAVFKGIENSLELLLGDFSVFGTLTWQKGSC